MPNIENNTMSTFTIGGKTFEIKDASARSNIQTINTVLDTKANSSNVTAIDTRVTGVEEDRYKPYVIDSASGAVASFTDGADNIPVKDLTVQIEPVQDLHGYDSPWPAGGGKNKLPNENGTYKGTTGNNIYIVDSESPVSLPAGTYYIKYFADKSTGLALAGFYLSINGGTASRVGTNHATQETVESFVLAEQSNITLRLYSSTTGFNEAKYRFMLTVEDSTNIAFSPYSNICPITGWTGANVTRTGKNLWDEEWEAGTLDVFTGAEVVSSVTMRSKNFIRVKPGMKCIAVGPYSVVNTNQFIICYYDKDGSYVNYISLAKPGPFNIPSDERIALMRFAYRYYLHDSDGIYNSDVSVNYPSTATAYEPYNTDSEFIDISFPTEAGTVYGGSLDVLSGVLTVDMAMVDLGTLTWNYEPNYNRHGADFNQIPNIKIPGGAIVPNALCSKYKIVSSSTGWANRYTVTAIAFNPTYLRVYNDGTADAATYKIAMSGVQFVYELATPITIQLTLNQVNSLLGVNNIWADSGDTEVEYRADTKLFIERLTAPDSADMIADANIVSGQYFMVGNTLYKATANIASGSAVIEGTNATRKSLSEALNEINQ